jgi:hypothetical protein
MMAYVVPNVRRATMERRILEDIRSVSAISTGKWIAYSRLAKRCYEHGTVDQWVDGIQYLNTLRPLNDARTVSDESLASGPAKESMSPSKNFQSHCDG